MTTLLSQESITKSSENEIQQRATEYLALLALPDAEVIGKVLDEMPPFADKVRQLRRHFGTISRSSTSPCTRRVVCSTCCTCLLDAGWGLQSDVVPDSRRQGSNIEARLEKNQDLTEQLGRTKRRGGKVHFLARFPPFWLFWAASARPCPHGARGFLLNAMNTERVRVICPLNAFPPFYLQAPATGATASALDLGNSAQAPEPAAPAAATGVSAVNNDAFFDKFWTTDSGVLYENPVLQIGCKCEFTGSRYGAPSSPSHPLTHSLTHSPSPSHQLTHPLPPSPTPPPTLPPTPSATPSAIPSPRGKVSLFYGNRGATPFTDVEARYNNFDMNVTHLSSLASTDAVSTVVSE